MRTLLPLLSLALVTLPAAAQAPHNVLLIVADDLGVDYVGCYGEGTSPPPTPTIDALAARGVLFRNAWANPSCSPTRACIQTGRYPFRTLVGRWIAHTQNPQNVGLLQPRERTLPELIDAAGTGHAHALIGKWHLHDSFQPHDVPRTIGGYSHFAGAIQGQIPDYFAWNRVVDGVAAPTTTYCTIQNTDDALAWIQAQTGPWFCVLTYQAPHIPYHAPPAHLHSQNLAGLTPQPLTHTAANRPFYRAMVQSLDTEMGRLFATLGPTVMDATNVLFIGDNGSVQQQSVAPFSGTRSKGTPYEGGVNVPLIVAGPAVQQGGRVVAALACAVDLFATVLDLTGAAAAMPPFVVRDSVSLVPYLTTPTQPSLRQFAYTEEFTGTAWPAPLQNGHATIRDARYKLIHRYNGTADEVFDLQADPWETTNLRTSSDPQVQVAYAALSAEITRLRGSVSENVVTFGTSSCPGWLGPPQIAVTGVPNLGSTVTLRLTYGPSSGTAYGLLGFSWTDAGGTPLPLALSQLGSHVDCVLSSSTEMIVPCATSVLGDTSFSTVVPQQPAMLGWEVFGAWVAQDNGAPANPAHIVSSKSVLLRIGS